MKKITSTSQRYLYEQRDKKYIIDFRKPRVKETTIYENGNKRTEVIDKFSLASMIQHNGNVWYSNYYDVYRYEEVKQHLLELLEKQQFENVTIIK